MGKKTGSTQRVKKRVDAIVTQLDYEKSEQNELQAFADKPDSELFVVDMGATGRTAGAHPPKSKQLVEKSKRGDKRHRISEQDQRMIRKLKASADKNSRQSLNTPSAPSSSTRFKGRQVPVDFNLWDDQEYIRCGSTAAIAMKAVPIPTGQASAAGTAPVVIQSIPLVRLRKDIQQPSSFKATSTNTLPTALQRKQQRPVVKVDVAQPGQSYRPDQEQHQDAIGEALAIELRRQDMLDYIRTPISQSRPKHDSQSKYNSDSDDEDEEEDTEDDPTKVAKRKREKLTRTQRNKQKRVRQERQTIQQRKREKKFMASLEEAKSVSKELKQLETIQGTKREQVKKLKQLQDEKPVGTNIFHEACQRDPIHAPSLPVALTEELEQGNRGGALRCLKTKGSLLTDRLESFVSRNILSAKVMERKMVVQGRQKRTKVAKDEFLLA